MSQSSSQSNMTAIIESAIKTEQKEKLAAILKHVSKLSDLEKLYLYFKLPTGQASEEIVRRSSLTPLSSASRTATTLKWIRSHYVEDKNVCVPKQDIYNQYRLYCETTNVNPVGSADFGKMVKTAFPNIHHRRLGQRGKSKYCYGGLKRKSQVEIPALPVLQSKPSECQNPVIEPNPLQEMHNLSTQLVCEWACRLFDKKFTDIKSLAQFLIQTGASYGKKAALFSMMYDNCGVPSRQQETKSSDPKLQDAQALLQRKLHQKEVLKEHMNLLKQQKSHREATLTSKPAVTAFKPCVINVDETSSPNCVGNLASGHHCSFTTHQQSSSRPESANFTNTCERVGQMFVKIDEALDGRYSVASQIVHGNNEMVSTIHREKHVPNDHGSESTKSQHDRQKQNQSILYESSSSMSISSDSDTSRLSPHNLNYDVDDHKHQKRMGDDLTGPFYDRVSKRRRCMTSLGMPHQEFSDVEAPENDRAHCTQEARIRPISCPTVGDRLFMKYGSKSVSKSYSKETFTHTEKQVPNPWKQKGSHKNKDKQRLSKNEEVSKEKSSTSSKSPRKEANQDLKSGKSSFHFVQKPTVIAVRQPGSHFPSVMSCPNFSSSQKFEDEIQEPPSEIKKTHNILNTLLSSDTNSLPLPDLSSHSQSSSSLPLSVQEIDSLDNCVNSQGRKLPHTLDNAYILSSQSSRSAFVPVASNKLQDFSRSRSSHPCLNIYSSSRSSSNDSQKLTEKHSSDGLDETQRRASNSPVSNDDKALNEIKQQENLSFSPHSPVSETSSIIMCPMGSSVVDTTASDHFKPIAYATSQAGTPVSSVISQVSIAPSPIVSASPVSLNKSSSNKTQLNNTSAPCVTKHPPKSGTKSPVTPPKRQSRSRFTPIRPKVSGCTPSPQKKDMRPVSTILKEQRVRNAQELLVNLANTYQGEVKLHMPAELLGLTHPGKSKSSDVLLTIGTLGCGSTKPGTSSITTTVSSLPLYSPSILSQATGTSLLTKDQCQQSAPLPQLTIHQSMNGVSENVAPPSNSQLVLLPNSTCNTDSPLENNTQETRLIIADKNGIIYTLDRDSHPMPLSQNSRNDQVSVKKLCSSPMKAPNVINVADINGQVIGPDNSGQTYLLIPSSEATLDVQTTITDSNVAKTDSVATLPSEISSVTGETNSLKPLISKETHGIQTLPSSAISSSSALLSELSQLASKQEKSQTLIQHDSALSAFHKCAPNKPQIITNGSSQELNLCPVEVSLSSSAMSVDKDVSCAQECGSLPQRQTQTASADSVREKSNAVKRQKDNINIQSHPLRKRKASKSRDFGTKDKKRQNISKENDKGVKDNVVIIDIEKQHSESGKLHDNSLTTSVKQTEISPMNDILTSQRKDNVDFSDTEALLQMIDDSRSLTVKQTVMALNSLKAELRKKVQDSSVCTSGDGLTVNNLQQKLSDGMINQEESQQVCNQLVQNADNGTHMKSIATPTSKGIIEPRLSYEGSLNKQIASSKQKSLPKIIRSSKRNMSLNLESLESDALLDNEPTLDHQLVVDVGGRKMKKSDNKTSVAVAAKTLLSSSLNKQDITGKKSGSSRSAYTISADTLRSYQMILNDKRTNKVEEDRLLNELQKDAVQPCTNQSTKMPSHLPNITHTNTSRTPTLPRRSLSCVRDILERGTSSVLDSTKDKKLKTIEKSSGADYFDVLLSKLQSKSDDSNTSQKTKAGCDLDIPVDVVDFVTESMSSRSMYNFPSARCLSVPNTKPDFCNPDDSLKLTSDNIINTSSVSNLVPPDHKQTRPFSDKVEDLFSNQSDEQVINDKQNVFLSPVGPAKLARRLSIEKSVSQPPVDRSMVKTPVEFSSLSLRHGTEPSSTKSSSKSMFNERQSTRTPVDRGTTYAERKRAKTPFEPTLIMPAVEKKGGKPGQMCQVVDEVWSSKATVNRSLTRTPMDKFFFNKIVSDSLLSKFQIENLSQQYSRDLLSGNEEYASSQTPTSDAGYGSISETPVSDIGYNSISPSPVMMSSSTFFGECGRRDITSPATIFMPLRSDSALSLSNNINSEQGTFPSQANLSDILPSVSNQCSETFSDESDQNGKSTPATLTTSILIQERLSSLSTNSSQTEQLHLHLPLEKDNERTESRNREVVSDSLDFSKLVSLQSIPTPPFSPNSSLMSTAPATVSPLPFNIPFSPLPNPENSPSPPSIPKFLLPCSTNTSFSFNNPHLSASSPRRSCPQDQQGPCVSHVLTPSPHILARPPSSPHQFGTHPSPPFTPSSQRSLPSPCPTPSSFKSLISPRSLTPSIDSSQIPNAFMPIQSSYVLTSSLAPTHSYIQPIKPVVTLASPSSHVPGNEAQVQTSNSVSGILSPSVGILREYDRLNHDMSPPNTSVVAVNEQIQFINSKKQLQSSGSTDRPASSSRECQISKMGAISPVSDIINGAFSVQTANTFNKESTQNNSNLNDQFSTDLMSGLGERNLTYRNGTTHSYQRINKNLRDSFIEKNPVRFLSDPQSQFFGQISYSNEDGTKLIQSSSPKAFYSPVSNQNTLVFSQEDPLHRLPWKTQITTQTNSPFTAVPSKLQVDLTKLETSQNPTSTIQSKPIQTKHCKINLDNCESHSSLQINPMGHNYLPTSMTPVVTPFNTVKRTNINSNYEVLDNLNPSVDNVWNERLSKSSCQDDLQATLEVLRDMDGQYFPSDEDNSNGGSAPVP